MPLDLARDEIIVPSAGALRIGRATGDVALYHPTVSDPHALVWRTVGGIQLRDLSRGQTFLNGRPITEVTPLRVEDRVQFGSIAFHVVDQTTLRRQTRLTGLSIVARSLSIIRGRERILDSVDLNIHPGEFIGLLGPSGSGKSTLLKCLAGYLPPAPGSTLQADELQLPAEVGSYRPLIGFAPQEDVHFPDLTVRENLDYTLRLRTSDLLATERRALIDSVLTQLGVIARADKLTKQISPGERKRVCVAQELLTRPRALYLDEPTSGLDPAHETDLMRILGRLAHKGMTVVAATHVLENVEEFNRVLVISQGRAAYFGSPSGLLKRFGARNYPDLYVRLEQAENRPADSNPLGSTSRDVEAPQAPARPPRPPTISCFRQTAVLMARGTRLMQRDIALVALLVGQPIAIGVLISLSQACATDTSILFTFAAITAVWLGLNNSARELVRDRRAYVRERLLGVTPLGYLVSKVSLLAIVGIAQICLLYGTLFLASSFHKDLGTKLHSCSANSFIAVLSLTYLGGELLGLLISAAANSQEAAVAVLPLVILPQLLLTGPATEMTDSGHFHSVRYLLVKYTQGSSLENSWRAEQWAAEILSLPLYTRPSVSLLKPPPIAVGGERIATSTSTVRAIDFVHLVFLVYITGVALVALFRTRERRWMLEA